MKIIFILLFSFVFMDIYGQVGINTTTPKQTLHVNGSVQITDELFLGGDGSTLGSPGEKGQVLLSDGSGQSPYWSSFTIPEISQDTEGTVIAVDGNFVIAQEIRVQLAQDFNYTNLANPVEIPNFTNIIIDNENTYTSDSIGNSFTVKESGTYSVTMNFMIQNAVYHSIPVIGIWNNTFDNGNGTFGKWVARINDVFAVSASAPGLRNQTYNLITTLELSPSDVYSFRVSNTETLTVASRSKGSTGYGEVTTAIVKRLK